MDWQITAMQISLDIKLLQKLPSISKHAKFQNITLDISFVCFIPIALSLL
jgi:hypothetical protein